METTKTEQTTYWFIWYMGQDTILDFSASNGHNGKHASDNSIQAFIEMFAKQDQSSLDQLVKDAQKKPDQTLHFEAQLAQDHQYVSLSISPVFEGEKRFIQVIDLQKQDHDAYREMIEHTRDMLTIHSPEGIFYYLSPSVKDILGYEPEELVGLNPYQSIFHSEDVKTINEASHQKALSGRLDNYVQYRALHKSGHYVWLESYTKPVYNDEGQIKRLVVSSRDVTYRKELEIFLDETGKLASVGGWQYFPENDKLEWTPETYRIHEIPLGTEVDLETAIGYYHPDYRSLIREKVNALIQKGTPYDIEAKIITAHEKEKWVRTKGQAEMVNDVPKKILGSFQDITDRKLTEEKLKATENRTQQLTEHAIDLIFWLDTQGFFTYLNPAALELTDYKENELLGQHFQQVVAEEHFQYAAGYFNDLINQKKDNFYLKLQIAAKSGAKYWVGIHVQSIYANGEIQEVVGIARDITKQVEAEEALKATTSRLYALIENLQSGILVENENRELIFTNQYFVNLFQVPYAPSEMEGFDCAALLKDAKGYFEDPDAFEATVNHLISNREPRIGEKLVLKDGRTFERDYIPVFQGENYLGHLWQYNDVTEYKKTEEALIQAKEEAEKASQAQADFLSTMSHEIRTPLNAVIGLSDILLQQNPKKEQIENLKALKFSGENLLNLINDILDFNKIEAGKIEIDHEPFNLDELIRGLQKTHAFKAEEKGIKLKYLADSDIPNYLIGDKTRLAQILNNLVSNALKFTSEGGVTIETEKEHETESDVTVYFAVVDTGMGIPKDKQDAIFDSFTQTHSSSKGQFGGTGLGLSITKRLLDLQNSSIQVNSEEGEGTRFAFSINFKKDEKQAPETSQPLELEAHKQKLAGKKVLMVEDNQMNIFMARQFLENWDMEVSLAYNGKEAVEQAESHQFDVILMDLQMPEMNGYEAAKQIRKLNHYQKVPIIALTASALMEVQDKVYSVGMNDYITKPFDPKDLSKKIANNLLTA